VSSPADTIAAIATAPARGAIGIVRISGPRVPAIAREILGFAPVPRRVHHARFLDARGESIDEGIALYFQQPASFTGEAVLELQGHGGMIVMDLVLKRVLELGARVARAGEFSERAFLNGKMDIAQAEAVADLIDAGSAAAARAAVRSMRGEFSARIGELQALITDLRVHAEAAIDFTDEDIDFLQAPAITARLAQVLAAFAGVETAARQGALLREGLTVVIAGKPNAGKSSLLNALAGADVAIVTPAPGTTRDVLREHVNLDGLPLSFVDTAGLRVALDAAEQEGIRRAHGEMRRADRILYVIDVTEVLDAGAESQPPAEDIPAGVPLTLVLNKIDLVGEPARVLGAPDAPRIYLSARTRDGIDLLRTHLKESAGYRHTDAGALTARRRHLDALARARELVGRAAAARDEGRPFELFAEDLRLAQRALGEITGEFSSEDLLGAIFASFCIGK
jgi:tRNA modification GTPase